ncbi:hypothetical protein CDHC01_1896 [Corynebacterium diphtheriae HC01]|nr:hypothetical protein CDHC01_1896 [Corynebacterium diphtheriae HC01]
MVVVLILRVDKNRPGEFTQLTKPIIAVIFL